MLKKKEERNKLLRYNVGLPNSASGALSTQPKDTEKSKEDSKKPKNLASKVKPAKEKEELKESLLTSKSNVSVNGRDSSDEEHGNTSDEESRKFKSKK